MQIALIFITSTWPDHFSQNFHHFLSCHAFFFYVFSFTPQKMRRSLRAMVMLASLLASQKGPRRPVQDRRFYNRTNETPTYVPDTHAWDMHLGRRENYTWAQRPSWHLWANRMSMEVPLQRTGLSVATRFNAAELFRTRCAHIWTGIPPAVSETNLATRPPSLANSMTYILLASSTSPPERQGSIGIDLG